MSNNTTSRLASMIPNSFIVSAAIMWVSVVLLGAFKLHTDAETRKYIIENETKIELKKIESSLDEAVREHIRGISISYGTTEDVTRIILRAADSVGISHDLAMSLVREESGFRPKVVSYAGAIGLTQVMPNTGAWLDPDADLYDPLSNAVVGFTYLSSLIDRYGDQFKALVAYNVGPTRVDNYGVGPYTSSQQFANRVLGDI